MTPESLVLQPKVTEVRWTEQTGPWTWGALRSHQQKCCTLTGGLIWAGKAPAVLHLSSLPSDESTCLLCLLICGADTLKWRHRGPTNTSHTHVGVYKRVPDHFCHPFQSSTLFPITFNQWYDSLTVALSLCLSILPWSVLTCPLLQCLFFFSPFLSADSHWHTEN